MYASDLEITVIAIGIAIFLLVIFIVGGLAQREQMNKLNELKTNTPLLSLDLKTTELLKELSKWINNCKRCSGDSFYIKEANIQQLKIVCNSCGSYSTLKSVNTFYSVDVIEDLVNHFITITDLMSKYHLDVNVAQHIIDGNNEYHYHFYNRLQHEYFLFKRLKNKQNMEEA